MDILEKIREQINSYPIILYMKGTPQFPMCGFSSRAITILKRIGQPFAYINILQEPDVRENMIKVSEWPTFPQLFVNGELVGGCDIMEEMDAEGELATLLNSVVWPEEQETSEQEQNENSHGGCGCGHGGCKK